MAQSSGDVEQELAAALARLAVSPNDPDLQLKAARLLHFSRRFSEASEHFQRATEAAPYDSRTWFDQGMAAADRGDTATFQRALERFELTADETAVDLTRRAIFHGRNGEHRAARAFAERALSVTDDSETLGWTHRVLAQCYAGLGEEASQLQHLEAATAITAARPRDIAEIAHLQEQLKREVTVLPLAETLTTAEPENAEAWYALGAVANRAGDPWRAREALERAERMGYRNQAGLMRELGAALCHLGRHQEGIPKLQSALEAESSPEARARLHQFLGYFYSRRKNREQALTHYRAAVELDPANADAQQGLGASYADLHDYEAALPHLKEATRLDPEAENRWYALGRVLAWVGEWKRAEAALTKSIALGRKDGKARAQLAWVYQRQGLQQAAVQEAKRALRQTLPRKWRRWVAGIANASATTGR